MGAEALSTSIYSILHFWLNNTIEWVWHCGWWFPASFDTAIYWLYSQQFINSRGAFHKQRLSKVMAGISDHIQCVMQLINPALTRQCGENTIETGLANIC